MINGFEQAVYAALQGNSEGFDYLYQMTFKDKYYIALKYMKNEADAQDVLQDAYVRAFSKLTTLTDPAKFPQWLGMIVSNTAKNALVKKNPMLFTDMASEDSDGNVEEFDIADESTQYQPELSYTQQETQELVRELINSLSDEQRLCVMMFHIDGYSISEIAQSLDCSENTVKSRLNYGRKNIKLKAEELQKRGVKLYSVSPVFLLMLLIRKEKHTPFVEAGAN
ncbi:MAG: RNA polymerase sigma factor, partial [Lachnospira sp.]|nr:RNA polymerase sigma factor [Lachnospira sp.]